MVVVYAVWRGRRCLVSLSGSDLPWDSGANDKVLMRPELSLCGSGSHMSGRARLRGAYRSKCRIARDVPEQHHRRACIAQPSQHLSNQDHLFHP